MFLLGKGTMFLAGTLFGSLGFKVLKSKEAKNICANALAFSLRAKDSLMESVTRVQENVEDIIAQAKDINEKRLLQEVSCDAE